MTQTASPFTRSTTMSIVVAYVVGGVMTLLTVGPWEAARGFAAEGLILTLWLWIAHKMLSHPYVEESPINRPGSELGIGLAGVAALAISAVAYYQGVRWAGVLVIPILYGLPLAILLSSGGLQALGLSNAPRPAWLAALAIVGVNVVVGIGLGLVLPSGELPATGGSDLAEELQSPLAVLTGLAQVLFIAAIPEELFFRAYLQPRLARYMPLGWAIVAQALLFSAVHLPQHVIRFGYPWPFALAQVFSIGNGVIGGYLWSRTRSLPLLIVLHLLAYPRFGL